MIKKRPLCMAVLVVTLLLLLLPSGLWMKTSIPESRTPAGGLRGQICRIEPRADGQAIYLKHSYLSEKGIVLIYFDTEQDFSIGNTIQIEFPYRIWEPEAPSNPGQFDGRLYYQTQHITHLGTGKTARILDDNVFWPGEWLRRLRERLRVRCSSLFGEKQGGMLQAMLLGDKTGLDLETKDIYQKSGMSHLLAISGLHISIVGMSLYRFLRKRGCSYGISGSVGLWLVLLYGAMTGMSISTTRAVTMFGLAVGADLIGRSYDMLTASAVAALLLLQKQPLYARSASFLLSFGAVLGVGLFYPALQKLFSPKTKLMQSFLVSLSIQLVTLPLVQWFYYEIPLYAVFLNLLVIPLMGILMLCGIGALTVSFLSWEAARFLAFGCGLILTLYERLGQGSLRLPWSVIICGRPKIWQILLYYSGLICFVLWQSQRLEKEKWRSCLQGVRGREEEEISQEEKNKEEKKICRERCVSLVAALLLCVCLQLRIYRGLFFTMLDVGQGDGLFLRTAQGTTCLIDGGSSDVKEVGRYRLIPFLKEQGVGKLDYVLITHTDQDHISGVEELLEQAGKPGGLRIGSLLLSKQSVGEEAGLRLTALAKEAGIRVRVIKAGVVLKDRKTSLYCLHPADGKEYIDKNAGSLVFRLSYKEFSIMLTGDLEETGEREILEGEQELTCDVLKAGHHGSRFSTTEEWLERLCPSLTLISCGEDNAYGHPHEETLERLKRAGSRSLLTTEQGAITIHSDGKGFYVEAYGLPNALYGEE